MMFWSFIGLEILEFCQFRKTCSLILIINIIMLCLIYIFDFRISDDNYSIIRIILLALLYLFISLTLGSSSLISQQAVINIYSNLHLFYDENVNENYNEAFSESGNDIKNNENTQNLKNIKNIITKEKNINNEVNDNNKEIIYNNNIKNHSYNINYYNNEMIENIEEIKNKSETKRNKEINILSNETIEKLEITENNSPSFEKNNILNKKQKMDKLSFWFVYLTTMMGYLSKYYIYKLLLYLFKVSEDYANYNDNSNLTLNDSNITNNTNDIIINNNITINNTIINGKINLMNTFKMSIDEKYIFLIICAIYIFFILLSIILYSIFKSCIFENKNSKKFKCNKYCCICKIFFKIVNYVFYIEKIEVKKQKIVNCVEKQLTIIALTYVRIVSALYVQTK